MKTLAILVILVVQCDLFAQTISTAGQLHQESNLYIVASDAFGEGKKASKPSAPRASGDTNLARFGVFSLGTILGFLCGFVFSKQKFFNFKLVAAFISLALAGAPLTWLNHENLRYIYPIGLLAGFIGTRLVSARSEIIQDKPHLKPFFAITDTVLSISIIVALFFSALLLIVM
jgi:hypothetical protein